MKRYKYNFTPVVTVVVLKHHFDILGVYSDVGTLKIDVRNKLVDSGILDMDDKEDDYIIDHINSCDLEGLRDVVTSIADGYSFDVLYLDGDAYGSNRLGLSS